MRSRLKKLLAVLLTVTMVFTLLPAINLGTKVSDAASTTDTPTATSGGQYTYVKVTTAPSDWSGEYLIVYETNSCAFDGTLTTLARQATIRR